MKKCSKCGELKELTQFNKCISKKDGHRSSCRKCDNKLYAKYRKEVRGHLPMVENKECAQYLGIAVAERLVKHLFDNVIQMPNNNTGYDFICARDMKIDVKSACLTMYNNKINLQWKFNIRKNKIADYFLLLAFNNRTDLEPLHQWLIPSCVLNHLKLTAICPSTIDKWGAYRQDIGSAIICCDTIKKIGLDDEHPKFDELMSEHHD